MNERRNYTYYIFFVKKKNYNTNKIYAINLGSRIYEFIPKLIHPQNQKKESFKNTKTYTNFLSKKNL